LSRRSFVAHAAMAAIAIAVMPLPLLAEKNRHMPIGHTAITWPNPQVEEAIRTCGRLGFYGVETFGEVLDTWETKGGLQPILQQSNIPLVSVYCRLELTDSTQLKAQIAKAIAWSKLMDKYQAKIFVLGPNHVDRAGYDFAANKASIINALNDGEGYY
jgi:inosose dehydratase